MNELLVVETLTLISASALSIALLSRFGLPAVLGYLFAGILVGPPGLGIAASDGARFLADLGLVLLMFMVGLEFSWAEMRAARRAVFGAGSLQVLVSMACIALVARAVGMSWATARLAPARDSLFNCRSNLRHACRLLARWHPPDAHIRFSGADNQGDTPCTAN